MADFRTHITTSCVLGVGYGVAGLYYLHLPPTTCALAAGLCGLSGMLPDLDSDSGIPVRETLGFVAAMVPMLMIERWQSLGLSHESMAVAGILTYLMIRFGIGGLFKRYTVHRGMWHSIPAAASAGLLAFPGMFVRRLELAMLQIRGGRTRISFTPGARRNLER